MAWQKWDVLDYYLDEDSRDGGWTDSRVVVAFACIKANLMRFGIANADD